MGECRACQEAWALWARFFALTALLAVVAGVTYVVLQPPSGGSDQLPLGAPVATATPTIGPVAPTPTTGRVLREVTLNDGGMIFEDDFELLDLRGWSNPANDVSQIEQFTRFLGRFGNETVTLNLAALPPHDQVELTFDLYLIDSWNGSDSPDFFKVGHSGSTSNLLLHTFSTYCEQERSYTATQPESCGELIGFGRVRPDSIYRNLNNGFVFEHSESTLSISFTGQKPDASDHFWGIDNIRVSIRGVATVEPVRATGPIAGLPAGAVPFRDHYYLIVNSTSWLEANGYAESLGGYLVAIGDDAEHQFVADLASGQGFGNVLIGLTDETDEGRFVWANGEPLVYTNWNSGEPNNAGPTVENYVNLQENYGWRWNDVPDFGGPFMVEFEGLPTPIQPPAGLVAWWPGDGNANDIIGGNHGTLQNGATFAPGIVSQAFDLTGDGYVDIGDIADFEITSTSSMSIAGWFKKSIRDGILVSKADVIAPDFGWYIRLQSDILDFRIVNNDFAVSSGIEIPGLSDDRWYHFVATHDGSTGIMNLYVDSVLGASATENFGAIDDGGMRLRFGITSEGHDPFSGLIDEVQIYNRALTADEIRAIYDAGSAGLTRYGGTLTVGMLYDHVTFDPPSLGGLPDIAAVQHTYDGLVFRDADLSIQPALATSWETNADATLWTFKLREGVRFSHGKGFKADDVIFTFNRLFDVGSPLASVMPRPLAIAAVDDLTVRFFFSEPNAVLLESLVKYHAYITPSDVDPARFARESLGTGPFIMTNHAQGATEFKKNPDYWNEGLPLLDEVTFIYQQNADVLADMLVAGDIDVIYDLDISVVDNLQGQGNPDTLVAQAPSGRYMNLAMDVRQPPFDNVLVRRALQAATDRETILQVALQGLGGIAYDHPITEGDPVFNPGCRPPEYDPQLARALLEDAGYPDGIDLTLYTGNPGGASMVEMAEVFQKSAAAAGINIEIVVMPGAGYWTDVWMQTPFYTSWWGGRPPHEAFSVVYRSDAAWNESYWSNPDFDAVLDQAAGRGDLEEQKALFGKLQCIVVDEVPRIIPVFQPVLLGLRQNVRDVEPMWDATLSLHRAWLVDAPGPIPTATVAPVPTATAFPAPPVVVTATPTPASVPLPPQPQGPRGTLNVIDNLGNEQYLLRLAGGERPLWYIGEPLVWWDWEVEGPTSEAILESWEFTDNAVGSVDWVLSIKPGVKFHKGWGEVTSTDIKFAFTEMLKEGTRGTTQTFFGNFYGSDPDNLDDSDPLVLRVHQPEKLNLIEQFRRFSADTSSGLRPFSKAYLEQVGEDEFARNPIYAGPYEFTSQQPGFDLVLTAVSDHYRVTPGFETIHYFNILESATKAAALLTGQIDITALTPGQVQQVQGAGINIALSRNAVESFVQFGGLYTTNPDYNPNSPWTTNNPLGGSAVEVRKALNYAIDRQTILDNILFGLGDIGIISYSFLNSTAGPGGGPPPWWNDAWEPYPFNPALAREILAGAGYPNCFQFNMWLTDTMVYGQTIGEVVAAMWEEHLGCEVNITLGPYGGGLRPMIIEQKTDGWTYPFDLSITRPQGRACLSGGPAEVHPAYIGAFRFSKLAFLTSLCSIADKSLDPVEIANLERQIGDQQYRVFNTAPIASVHVPFGVGPKVRSWEPLPKNRLLGGLEFAQPA